MAATFTPEEIKTIADSVNLDIGDFSSSSNRISPKRQRTVDKDFDEASMLIITVNEDTFLNVRLCKGSHTFLSALQDLVIAINNGPSNLKSLIMEIDCIFARDGVKPLGDDWTQWKTLDNEELDEDLLDEFQSSLFKFCELLGPERFKTAIVDEPWFTKQEVLPYPFNPVLKGEKPDYPPLFLYSWI